MELTLDTPHSRFMVRHVGDGIVTLADRILRQSFLITAQELVEDWPVRDFADLDPDRAARILDLQPLPEVVLLGCGARQRFAPPAVQAHLLERGIGLECMDNAACARTFNLLLNEGRHVAAAFILGAGNESR